MTDTSSSEPEIVAQLYPTPARYWFGIITIGTLGLFLLWICAAAINLSFAGRILVLACGLLLLYLAFRIHKSGRHGVLLTEAGLTDTNGNAICTIDSVTGVDRSFFAFKPSNGFLIRLNTSLPLAWHPGLWWRIGKRVGVGGITSAATGKAMSDALSLLLAKRDDPTLFDLDKDA